MLGAEISGRFALPPNSLSYCGARGFRRAFAAFLKNRTNSSRAAVEGSLRLFRAHYAYLSLIAKASRRQPFDAKVAEALWIGNPLLGEVRRGDLQKLIMGEFSGPGLLPRKKAFALASSLPRGALPHHSFHALYVHTISGVIAPSLKNADSCMVHWGRVISASPGSALVQSQRLARKNGRLCLVPCRRTLRLSCAGIALLPRLRAGDVVASHWGVAVMKLSGRQAANLESVTRRNIRAVNSGL